MVTFIGLQKDFGLALKELVELEYEMVAAYDAVLRRLQEKEYKDALASFKEDHQRHLQELSDLLKKHEIEVPRGPRPDKSWLTQGKVVLESLVGDVPMLKAMRWNENDLYAAYERLHIHDDPWPESQEVIGRCFQDEQQHKKWLDSPLLESSCI